MHFGVYAKVSREARHETSFCKSGFHPTRHLKPISVYQKQYASTAINESFYGGLPLTRTKSSLYVVFLELH